jgi:hypothetical protein
MVAGTVSEDELPDKFTVRCAVVAAAATGPLSVTVPLEEGFAKPPCTLVGFMATEKIDGGTTVKVADCAVVAPTFAEIDTPVEVATATTGVTVNVADVAFAGTVTLEGTVAALGVPLVNVTTVPPDSAGPVNVTVPVEVTDAPPTIEFGLRDTDKTVGGLTVSCPVTVARFNVAEIFAVVTEDTWAVFTVKLAVVACAAKVTVAGTVATALSLDSDTTVPPVIAGLVRVTVPVEVLPPPTLDGAKDTLEIPGVMAVTCTVPTVCVPL